MNGMDSMKTPVFMYCDLCCLISNFEAFRLLNLEVFETLLLIKKLLIKKTGCTAACLCVTGWGLS